MESCQPIRRLKDKKKNHSPRGGWVVNATPRPFYHGERDPVPTVQEAGWVLGLGLTGAEYLAPPGIDPRTVQPVASRCTECAISYILDMVWI